MPGDQFAKKVRLLAHFDDPAVSGISNDPYWGNVQAMWHADSNTDLKNSRTWSPQQNAVYTTIEGAGGLLCGYMPGNAAHFVANNQTGLTFGTGDFTIEARILPLSTYGGGIVDFRPNSTEGKYPVLSISGGNSVAWHSDLNVWHSSDTGLTKWTPHKWNHIAVSRISGVLRLFCNGVKVYEAADTTNYLGPGSSRPVIGGYGLNPLGAGSALPAAIDDFRITTGVGRYSADFTPHPKVCPQTAGSTQLALQDSMTESYEPVLRNIWEYFGVPVLSDQQFKFGGKSLHLTAATDYMRLPTSNYFNFGSGDFTIECFIRLDTLGAGTDGNTIIALTAAEPYRGLEFRVSLNGALTLDLYPAGTSISAVSTGTSAGLIGAGVWYHVAAVRANNLLYLFVDGVLSNTPLSYTGVVVYNAAQYLNLGYNLYRTSAGLQGWMDELRITMGGARYTATFTLPIAQFTLDPTSVSGTVEDENADPIAVPVYAYSEYDGRLLGGVMSSAVDGSFSIPVSERCFCVCVPPTKNARVFAHIDPV